MKNIYKTFSVVFVITIVLKILDVSKNLLIASKLGVSHLADIYLSVINIPESLVILIGLDTVRGVINSELSARYSLGNENEVKQVFRNLFYLLFWVSLILLMVIMFFKSSIINFLLPGFTGEKHIMASQIAAIIFPVFLFKALSGYLVAFFNALKKFYVPVIFSSVVSITVIISIYVSLDNLDIVFRLSYGNLIGNILFFLILFLIISKTYTVFQGIKFKIDKVSVLILNNCKFILAYVFLSQLYLFSRNYFASFFSDGVISIINYASSVTGLIGALIFNTIFSVLLSNLSSSFATEKIEIVEKMFFDAFIAAIYFIFPIVILLVVVPKEILVLAYLRGQFDLNSVNAIVSPFIWESLGLISLILNIFPLALFLARREYTKLTIIGGTAFAIGIFSNYLLSRVFGYIGIPAAGFFVNLFYGLVLIYETRSYFRLSRYYSRVLKILLSAVVTFVIVKLSKTLFFDIESNIIYFSIINILIVVALIFITYYYITSFLKINIFKKSFLFMYINKEKQEKKI